MSTTFTLDTSTSRAHPVPEPVRRLTVPAIRARKKDGATAEPLVMLTAYTARMAQLLDPHCDILLVGDSLGQVIYGLDTTVRVTLDMMVAHGAAVVRGSYRSVVVVDLPFGTYEASKEEAFASAARVLRETGAAAVKLEGGEAMAETVAFLGARGIPVMGHVGLTPQAVNASAATAPAAAARRKPPRSPPMRARSPTPAPSPSSWRASWSRSPAASPVRSRARSSASALRPPATARCW
jgi:3-methyl-2-oxobutanoate hydroxymethyltransferase